MSASQRAGRAGSVRAGFLRPAPRVVVFLAILMAFGGRAANARAATHWRIAPAPSWPETSAPLRAIPAPLGNDADAGGQHVQLLAHEARIAAGAESFWHVTSRITGQAGLQANSQLNVEFDPSYQTLVFHYVQVLRGETRINLLQPRSIKEVQREAGLENQVFDSRESAVIFLEDLRVGDVIDYAYTLQGSDPTLAGTVDEVFMIGVSVPVDHLVARLVTDRDRELSVSLHGPMFVHEAALAPRINHDSTEFRWDLWATRAYPVEADTPKWFDPLPFARISGFKTWRDVAAWGGRFFSGVPAVSGPARAWVEQQVRQGTQAGFVLRTARFVQDEIRYVGMEVGIARRQASDPNLTFQRRYGDCKDKTALLVALLRSGQVEAEPVLVSSTHGPVLDESAPSGSVFDHAIVRVTLAGKHYFIDPTNALQGGGIERFRYSQFARALVLNDQSSQLEALPSEPQEVPSVSILDQLHMKMPSAASEATLDTVRTYRGSMADFMRVQLRAMAPEQRSKTYLSIYQPDYPDIHELAPIEETDDRADDTLKVAAHFGVPHIWSTIQHGEVQARVSARSLVWLLPRPPSNARAAPLEAPFPALGRQVIEIYLPFDLPRLTSKPEWLATNVSSFHFDSSYTNRRLTYDYEVGVKARAVAPGDMQQQTSTVEKALTLMERTVLYREGLSEAGWRGVNWSMALFALCVLAGSAVFSVWVFGTQKTIANTRRERGPPIAFGGWLLLLAFGVLSAPILFAVGCFRDLRVLLSLSRWQALTTPDLDTYRPGLAAILVATLAVRLGGFSYSFTVAGALLKKRRSFPWHFTIYTACIAAFHTVQAIALSFASKDSGGVDRSTVAVQAAIYCAVWVTYLRNSRRVADTFTNGRRKPYPKKKPRAEREAAIESEL